MADEKQVIIGTDDSLMSVMYGTGVKESPEINENTVDTFSGAVLQGKNGVAYTIEISKLRYEEMGMHEKLDNKLEEMMSKKDNLTIIDTVKPSGEKPYQVIKRYFNCLVTGNDYEMKPEEHTTESLKFKAERRETEYKYITEETEG